MMSDLALTIRMELFRLNPRLSVSQADGLIHNIAECYRDISRDDATHGADRRDFFDFSLLDGVALATIYRESEAEVFVFAADESLIHDAAQLAMIDVGEFIEILRQRFQVPPTGLRVPISELSLPRDGISAA